MENDRKYVEGDRYRVLKDGGRFEGLLLFGEQNISGWSRNIKAGEVLTCLGWREVHALGVNMAGIMWTGAKVPENAVVMQFWPFESLFRPIPMSSYLERLPDEEELAKLSLEEKLTQAMMAPVEPSLEEIDDGHIEDLTNALPEIKRPVADPDEIVDLTSQ